MKQRGRMMAPVRHRGENFVGYKNRSFYFDPNTEAENGVWIVFQPDAAREVDKILRLPSYGWRTAELADVVDRSITTEHGALGFLSKFPSNQVLALYRDNHGQALDELTALVEASPFLGGAAELTKDLDFSNRVTHMPNALHQSMRNEATAAQLTSERLSFDLIEASHGPERAEALFSITRSFASSEVIGDAILALAETLHAMRLADEELEAWLVRCDFNRRAGFFNTWSQQRQFWDRVSEFYFFPQNERGSSIDITDAYESTFQAGVKTIEARRIGRLRPGRKFLRIFMGHSEPTICIAGSRRLKMDVAANGGELRRMGVTLTIGRTEDEALNELLVEVEQLELLASLNPAEAVRRLPRVLTPSEPIAIAAERAANDHRWGRILADLLIEELFSIDSDVIRRKIRSARTF